MSQRSLILLTFFYSFTSAILISSHVPPVLSLALILTSSLFCLSSKPLFSSSAYSSFSSIFKVALSLSVIAGEFILYSSPEKRIWSKLRTYEADPLKLAIWFKTWRLSSKRPWACKNFGDSGNRKYTRFIMMKLIVSDKYTILLTSFVTNYNRKVPNARQTATADAKHGEATFW